MKNKNVFSFLIPLIVAALIYCLSDILLKIGNESISFSFSDLINGVFLLNLLKSWSIIIAFISAILSKLIMGYVLSKNPMGIAESFF